MQAAARAKERLRAKFGEKLPAVFKDLKIYFVSGVIENGGYAYSGANAIIMDIENAILTVEEAEKNWVRTVNSKFLIRVIGKEW